MTTQQINLNTCSDLELAQLQGQAFQQLSLAQANVQALNTEIEKRSAKTIAKPDEAPGS